MVRRLTAALLLSSLLACTTTAEPPGPVMLSLNSIGERLLPNETVEFSSKVTGSNNQNVSWQVSAGRIEGSGTSILYTAPSTEGRHRLSAIAQADKSQLASASIVVGPAAKTLGLVGNNAAVLTGEQVGTGQEPRHVLRKPLPLGVETPSTTFVTGNAFVTRDQADTEYSTWFIEVKNLGTEAQCFIEAKGLRFKDEQGQIIYQEDISALQGSMGLWGQEGIVQVYTDTCLDVGEVGYLFGLGDNLYTKATSVELDTVVSETFGLNTMVARKPELSIVPQDYLVANGMNVSVKNQGSTPGIIVFAKYIALDEQGLPLTFSYLDIRGWDGILEPGETGSLLGYADYHGQASSIKAFVHFEPIPAD